MLLRRPCLRDVKVAHDWGSNIVIKQWNGTFKTITIIEHLGSEIRKLKVLLCYAHIKVFKKAIKANGETLEVDIINLFGFTLRDNIFERGENYVQNHPNYILKSCSKHFASNSKL
jgi:hypothetical protein